MIEPCLQDTVWIRLGTGPKLSLRHILGEKGGWAPNSRQDRTQLFTVKFKNNVQ